VDFVSGDRMSYITLRGHWCGSTVLNVHAPTEDKSGGAKCSFCEEQEFAFDGFSKYHIKLLSYFNAKVE